MLGVFVMCFCLLLSSWASIHRHASLEGKTRTSRLTYEAQLKFVLYILLFFVKRKLALHFEKRYESLQDH